MSIYDRTVEDGRRSYFHAMRDPAASLHDTLAFHIGYEGIIYGDQIDFLYSKLAQFIPGHQAVIGRTALQPDHSLRPEFLAELAPDLLPRYFSPAQPRGLERVTLLAASLNDLRDTGLPAPINLSGHFAERPAFEADIVPGGTIFLGPCQFMYLFEQSREYVADATLRRYGDAVLSHPRLRLKGDAVLVQDAGAGTNFAHFAFDWVTRILHILESGLVDPGNCHFLMGGDMDMFQYLLLRPLCASYGLQMSQFIFPYAPQLYEIDGRCIYFSDILRARRHPAQGAHPASIALLKRLAARAVPVVPGESRLFISRNDARFRKLENEDELFAIAAARGFRKIVLSDHAVEHQAALFAGARYAAGAHGMGMTHVLFRQEPMSLLELFHPTLATDAYALMSRAFGHSHDYVLGETVADNHGGYRVDPVRFGAALDAMLGVSPGQSLAMCYDNALLADPPEGLGVVSILEAPKHIPRILPALVTDLSGRGLTVNPAPQLYIHGTYLVQHEAALLFGGNNLVSRDGHWSCEARAFKEQYLSFFSAPFFDHIFPGPKPVIDTSAQPRRLRLSGLTAADVEIIDIPVFLATPVEPANWGRWVVNVIPKTAQFLQYGGGRKFLCHVAHPWQRRLLNILGVPDDDILPHDPGRTYICEDLLTVEYSVNNFTVSAQERINLFQLVMRHAAKIPVHRKLFVSRASISAKNPHYRVLQNEAELTAMLEALGFVTIEPETLPFEHQVALFAGAEHIIFLGGSAIFNAAFCPPGTSILDIESSGTFANSHADFLASLALRYGVVFGTEDATDTATHHKRWSVDVPAVRGIVEEFF
jgi:capsular polysaccharide biosynthesis protein